MRAESKASVRPAAVAGRFYPGDAEALRTSVAGMLRAVSCDARPEPKALIVPHAGYVYSGPIAASAFAQWRSAAHRIKRVAVIGPAHYLHVDGVGASSASAFETPLGPVPVATEAVRGLVSKGLAGFSDAAHAPEHCIEVELPFLQSVLKDFSIVPLLVGDATASEVARVIEELWDDEGTRIVISSDLSHYKDYWSAQRLDRQTAEAIERLAGEEIHPDQACGQIPVCALLLAAKWSGLKSRLLDLRNSGDTAGQKDRVVGYGAFAIG